MSFVFLIEGEGKAKLKRFSTEFSERAHTVENLNTLPRKFS